MRPNVRLCVLASALLVAACASTPEPAGLDIATQWRDQVVAISAGDDTEARGSAIKQRLASIGLVTREEAFTSGKLKGTNIFGDLGGPAGAPLLLIGAHYDRVDKGRGATDNASGSAAVLELAAALKARPMDKHRVVVAFWDLEELGLLGSKAYAESPHSEKPALYVNFDVFGWGDTLWMMRPADDLWLDAEISAAAKANSILLRAGEQYPPTDHLAFLKEGLPAVSFSLADGNEIDGVLGAYAGQRDEPNVKPEAPKIIQVIHSDRDTIDQLEPTDVPAALRTIEDALRAWDAAASK